MHSPRREPWDRVQRRRKPSQRATELGSLEHIFRPVPGLAYVVAPTHSLRCGLLSNVPSGLPRQRRQERGAVPLGRNLVGQKPAQFLRRLDLSRGSRDYHLGNRTDVSGEFLLH